MAHFRDILVLQHRNSIVRSTPEAPMNTLTCTLQEALSSSHDLEHFVVLMRQQLAKLEVLCDGEARSQVRELQQQLTGPMLNFQCFAPANKVWTGYLDIELSTVLHARHPELSLTELRVCLLCFHQLSVKEIASLLCISSRSVENHRYRLRKKLKLQRATSLFKYVSFLKYNSE